MECDTWRNPQHSVWCGRGWNPAASISIKCHKEETDDNPNKACSFAIYIESYGQYNCGHWSTTLLSFFAAAFFQELWQHPWQNINERTVGWTFSLPPYSLSLSPCACVCVCLLLWWQLPNSSYAERHRVSEMSCINAEACKNMEAENEKDNEYFLWKWLGAKNENGIDNRND